MRNIINVILGIGVVITLGITSLFLCYLCGIKREMQEYKEEKDEQRKVQ